MKQLYDVISHPFRVALGRPRHFEKLEILFVKEIVIFDFVFIFDLQFIERMMFFKPHVRSKTM